MSSQPPTCSPSMKTCGTEVRPPARFVIASRRLTDGEDWTEFRRGSLMVFEDGDIVYGTR